jgi:hypothetical protein
VDKNLPHFVEHVSVVGNENSEKLRYRSQNCLKVLPFKTSSVASGTCLFCKKLKDHAFLSKFCEGKIIKLLFFNSA